MRSFSSLSCRSVIRRLTAPHEQLQLLLKLDKLPKYLRISTRKAGLLSLWFWLLGWVVWHTSTLPLLERQFSTGSWRSRVLAPSSLGRPVFNNYNSRGSICFAHIRFRKAWIAQGNTLDEIPFKAAAGVWGSWLGLFLNIICLIAQFYIALFPIGSSPSANAFFQAYLAAPIVLAFFIGWKLYHRTRFVKAHEVDLVSGRRDMNLVELRAQEREDRLHWGVWKRYVSISSFAKS